MSKTFNEAEYITVSADKKVEIRMIGESEVLYKTLSKDEIINLINLLTTGLEITE